MTAAPRPVRGWKSKTLADLANILPDSDPLDAVPIYNLRPRDRRLSKTMRAWLDDGRKLLGGVYCNGVTLLLVAPDRRIAHRGGLTEIQLRGDHFEHLIPAGRSGPTLLVGCPHPTHKGGHDVVATILTLALNRQMSKVDVYAVSPTPTDRPGS